MVREKGRPVLLLHGFPDTGRLWSKQIGPLADAGFRLIVPDQRGYGRSDKPADVDAYNLLLLAADRSSEFVSVPWRYERLDGPGGARVAASPFLRSGPSILES